MKSKKMPAPQRAGTETMVTQFAQLVSELAALDPEALRRFGERMKRESNRTASRRSYFPNKTC